MHPLSVNNRVARTLGPEKATNGSFASGTGWTLNTGWAVSGGKAVHTAGSALSLWQWMVPTAGKVYRLTYTISGMTAGSIQVTGVFTGVVRSANGTYTEDRVLASANTTFVPSSSFNGSISNVSLREVK